MPAVAPFSVYGGLSTPTVVFDADYRIVYLNPSAERFCQVQRADVIGHFASEALHVSAPTGQDFGEWLGEVIFPAIASGDPFAAVMTLGGRAVEVQLSATRLHHDGEWYAVLSILLGTQADTPGWALTDPLTGLHNRHQWERDLPTRNARGGVVIFLDLDDLKQINDLHGHRQGDQALIRVAEAIRRHLPPGALAVRYGGDEFIVVAHDLQEEAAGSIAQQMVESLAAADAPAVAATPLHLSYGVASYRPGELLPAVERADEALYEQKGVLLRGSGGSRIILTGNARDRMSAPGSGTMRPGEFGRGFGAQFDNYFRQMYARAVEQAREFVAFAAPEPGSVVIEVGAGSGRITFDGGLAERIGSTGQLLVTDASQAQLDVARRRAEQLNLHWVRFLAAAAETLPVAPNTVDLVIGSTFLHFTDEEAVVRSIARVLRPGGRFALHAGLALEWGPAWVAAFTPIREALAQQRVSPRDFFVPRERLVSLFARAGFTIQRESFLPRETASYPSADVAVAVARQARLAALSARGLPTDLAARLEEDFEGAFRRHIEALGLTSADFTLEGIYIVASKPAS